MIVVTTEMVCDFDLGFKGFFEKCMKKSKSLIISLFKEVLSVRVRFRSTFGWWAF